MNPSFRVIQLKNLLHLAVAIALPLAVGGLSALLTANSRSYYEALAKPPLSPPGAAFPIIWTFLYIFIGIASYLVYKQGFEKDNVRDALYYYAASLVVNFIWPLVFFRYQMPFLAFWVLLLYWLLVGITTAKFYRINHAAGLLMLPLWLWVTFAGYLNLSVWLLNR